MSNQRPRIKIPYQPIDIIIEMLSITLLLLMIIYIITEYANLPEIIPTHFNAKGEADGFGSRITLWIVPSIASIMYIGMFFLSKYPHLHNYMVNITEENALKNYRFSTRMVRIVNLFAVILMTYIAFYIVNKAKGIEFELGSLFLPIVIGFSIVLPIVILIIMKKLNR